MIAFGLPALPHAISAADRTADAAPAPWDHHRCARRSRRGLDAVSGRACAGRTGRPGDEHRAHPASGWSSDGAGVIWTVLLSG